MVTCLVVEHLLEVRDAERLAAHDTYLLVSEHRVRYRLRGEGQPGPTVVLIPALGGSVEQWVPAQEEVAAFAPSFTYDRAGMGFSDPTPAHDAEGEAAELADVLRNAGVAPPWLVVSYSSSSLVARTFVAHHSDQVRGVVFVDPMVPEAGACGPTKTCLRVLGKRSALMVAKGALGILRLAQYFEDRKPSLPTELEARTRAILARTSQWVADLRDVVDLDRSARQAMAAPFPTSIPVGVLSTVDPAEGNRNVSLEQQKLATRAALGTFRQIHGVDHTRLLQADGALGDIVALIQKVENDARGWPADGTPPPQSEAKVVGK